MLMSIGCTIKQVDDSGKQYRVSHGAFIGGSGDGIALGVPDVPAGEWCLLEFKTHGEKSFLKLQKQGLLSAKPEHFNQMQMYMHKMGLYHGLYMAVNKNTDDLHAEIVELDNLRAGLYFERGERIVNSQLPPVKIGASAESKNCKYCEFADVCHENAKHDITCRTCVHAKPSEEHGSWICLHRRVKLSKTTQLKGCVDYKSIL